jgi:DNA-binding NarL/FixJ family response regulator
MTVRPAPHILKVVTVEDSLIIADRLQSMLREMNNISFLGNARNIATALNLISLQKPHVVILDILLQDDMPNANGLNLLIILKKKYPNLKVIMLTNLSGTQYRNTCVAFGADCFLDKTNEFELIPETLKKFSIPETDLLSDVESKKRPDKWR